MNHLKELGPQSESEILAARARQLARVPKESEVEGDVLHLVRFNLGEECYAVEIALVREVQTLEVETWSRVPCTPGFIVGAVNIRGRVYSIMDVGSFLGLPDRPISETACVLLVRSGSQGSDGEMELSILVDAMPTVVSISIDAIQPPQTIISPRAQEYVRGVTDEMLVILDLERLLSDSGIIVYDEV